MKKQDIGAPPQSPPGPRALNPGDVQRMRPDSRRKRAGAGALISAALVWPFKLGYHLFLTLLALGLLFEFTLLAAPVCALEQRRITVVLFPT